MPEAIEGPLPEAVTKQPLPGNPSRERLGFAGWNVQEGPGRPDLIGPELQKMARAGVGLFVFQEHTSKDYQERDGYLEKYLPGWEKYFYHDSTSQTAQRLAQARQALEEARQTQDEQKIALAEHDVKVAEKANNTRGIAIVKDPNGPFGELREFIARPLPKPTNLARVPGFRDDEAKGALLMTFGLKDSTPPAEGTNPALEAFAHKDEAVCIANLHLNISETPWGKAKQLEAVLAEMDKNPAGIKLVMGDFNQFDPVSKFFVRRVLRKHGYDGLLKGPTASLTKIQTPKSQLETMVVASGIQLHSRLDAAYYSVKPGFNPQVEAKVLSQIKEPSDHYPYTVFMVMGKSPQTSDGQKGSIPSAIG